MPDSVRRSKFERILTFTIDFETAKRYRKANKMPH